ncbi:MAG TPA: hypothetical protein VLI05_01245 [Candidatus Saccharimonadia bacterium]|nr:hypothetical protein [Candidatus Saccharimonadia bacterium]
MPPRGRTSRLDPADPPPPDPQASAIVARAEALQRADHDHDPVAGCTPECPGWTD